MKYKSGSSLLLTLLVMTTVAAMLITVSKAFIDNARFSSTNDSLQLATRMAQSGLEEGLLRIKQNTLIGGEYGNGTNNNLNPTPANPYHLLSMRRGFAATDTTCTLWSVDGPATAANASYNQNCPYYDLTIRNIVSLSTGSDAQGIARTSSYTLTGQDFGPATAINLQVREVDPSVSGQVNVHNSTNTATINCNLCSPNVLAPAATGIINNSVVAGQTLTLSVTSGAIDGGGLVITNPVSTSGGAANFALQKSSTTVEVTGYAGGVQKKLLYTVYTVNNSVQPNLKDSAISFDPYGFLTQ